MPPSLCDFAKYFSSTVGHDLEDGRREGHQWRETSWTDRMLLELKKLHDPRVIVMASNEPVTYADMEWWFIGPGGRSHLCVTLQAKILHYTYRNSTKWLYKDIGHPHAKPPAKEGDQAEGLIQYAQNASRSGVATVPLYLFYNPSSIVSSLLPMQFGGVALARGHMICNHLIAHRTVDKIAVAAKRHSAIRPFQFPLEAFFCWLAPFPTPEGVAAFLNSFGGTLSTGDSGPSEDDCIVRVGQGVPDRMRAVIIGRPDSDGDDGAGDGELPHRVIFLAEPRG